MARSRSAGLGTLLVRADADQAIGTGHVMRCLALAQAWQDAGGRVTFVCASLPAELHDRLLSEDIAVELLSEPAASVGDAHATAKAAKRVRAPWVVLDGYGFGRVYQQTLRETPSRVLAVDDDGRVGEYLVDVVLDQNLGAREASYSSRPSNTTLLLGPGYALLRREFTQCRNRGRDPTERPHRILVTLGGAGGGMLADAILDSLARLDCDGLAVHLVSGAAAGGMPSADAAGRQYELQVLTDVRDMAQHMAWADGAVSACGSTVWELAFMGLPAVLIVVADNQVPIAAQLQEYGVFPEVLTLDEAMDGSALPAAVRRLVADTPGRRGVGEAGRALVDGCGPARVVGHLMSSGARSTERQ